MLSASLCSACTLSSDPYIPLTESQRQRCLPQSCRKSLAKLVVKSKSLLSSSSALGLLVGGCFLATSTECV